MALADKIKPYVREIVNAHEAGDIQATQIIRYYEMHRDCPGDPAAPAFCEAAFDDWMKSRKAGNRVTGPGR